MEEGRGVFAAGRRVAASLVLAAALLVSACGREAAMSAAIPAAPLLPPGAAKKCVLLLHGKGGGAQPGSVNADIEYLRPGGNAEGWGGREWRYFPEEGHAQVRASLDAALTAAGCGHAIVQGFSNGGAAAAKLYCRAEDFGGRVIGYIIDDPVPDEAVLGCKPRAGMRLQLYWTGGLGVATDGWSCAAQDWTCEGGHTIGIPRYARELGASVVQSIHTTHAEYASPPEVVAWFGSAAN
jgi:pimeloyl-ACP methyl ester carboxylesterase